MGNQRSLLSGQQLESLVRVVDETTQSAVLLSPKQNPTGLWSCCPLQHTYHPLLETDTVTEQNYLQLPFTKMFLHLQKPFLLTIYKYLINVNSAVVTTWKDQILHTHYFKYKIGSVTTGPVWGNSSRLSDIPPGRPPARVRSFVVKGMMSRICHIVSDQLVVSSQLNALSVQGHNEELQDTRSWVNSVQ